MDNDCFTVVALLHDEIKNLELQLLQYQQGIGAGPSEWQVLRNRINLLKEENHLFAEALGKIAEMPNDTGSHLLAQSMLSKRDPMEALHGCFAERDALRAENDRFKNFHYSMPSEVIDSFTGENHYLSNFYPVDVTYEGIVYPSSECAFQAAKTLDLEERVKFTRMNPGDAKKAGRKLTLRSDWEDVKLQVMWEIVYTKFYQNPKLIGKLLSTYPKVLIEGNTWGDTYWGVCKDIGSNHLGQLLMHLRDNYREWYSSQGGFYAD